MSKYKPEIPQHDRHALVSNVVAELKSDSLRVAVPKIYGDLASAESRIADLEAEVGRLREAMPELTKRRCRDCGNIAYHSEPVAPYVLCRKCGSQDTSKTLLDFPQGQPHAN